MSNFAFGTYRVSDLNPLHIDALQEAIRLGITTIDTASNYMDGGAERAVALALSLFDEEKRNELEIISKYGYIQGSALAEYKENPSAIKNTRAVVQYTQECYHCIDKEFLHDQLTASLERMQLEKIDCYLIHNPEYYLLDALRKGVAKEERLDEMYQRIENAFVGMEEEVKAGRISSYGISSNSFSLSHNSEEFLPYEDLLTLAQNAALIAGNRSHGFTTLELPINMLEREGLLCAAWAKANGLRVLANRPFNANYNGTMYRLAEYDESREYYHHMNELMEICDNELLRPLFNLLEQLDASKHKFSWVGDYDVFLYTQILPHFKKTLEKIEKEDARQFFDLIDAFLQEYKKMVAYECSKKTKKELGTFFKECNATMQECALNYLAQQKNVDIILIGMRKPVYVREILSLKR